ncbi:MAG: CHAT domain-containing protein, partial [Pyrinomonadaceae bacterium]
MPAQDYFECTLTLDNSAQAELTTEDRRTYTGKPSLSGDTLSILETQRSNLKDYGRTLFDALFTDQLLTGYRNALNDARGRKLRLRFEIMDTAPSANELSQLNWELLYDAKAAKGGDFLSRSSDIVFSRQRNTAGLLAGLGTADTLKLLVVFSCPNNLGDSYESLDRAELTAKFKETLSPLAGRIAPTFLPQATRNDLRDAVRDGDFDGVQFYGHGYRDKNTNETGLILEKPDGSADFVEEGTCLDLFKGKELRLLCLMACYSGSMKSDEDPFSGLALKLVRQNHQAVIAMKRAIKITSADAFLKYFYKYLKAFDGTVDAAVGEAWLQLSINGDDEWSIPTLYMRLTDGRLWTERQSLTALAATNATGAIKDGIVNYFRKGKVVPIIGPGILKDVLPSAAEIGQYLANKY